MSIFFEDEPLRKVAIEGLEYMGEQISSGEFFVESCELNRGVEPITLTLQLRIMQKGSVTKYIVPKKQKHNALFL